MKVKDLIRIISDEDPEMDIYLSGDPEGNDIRTIDSVFLIDIPDKENPEINVDVLCIYPTDNIVNF